jgi:hypothetical protein
MNSRFSLASIKDLHRRFMLPALGVFILFIALSCSDQAGQKRQQSLDDMKSYVKVHKDSIDQYLDKNWTDLDSEFAQKKGPLQNETDKMNAEMKESYNATLRDWDAVKSDYADKQAERTKLARMDRIRSQLYRPQAVEAGQATTTTSAPAAPASDPQSITTVNHSNNTITTSIPTTVKPDFSKLAASELEPQYKNFVDIVKQNKDEYTQEDWTVVNTCWKDLNNRRKEIKSQIAPEDDRKISKLRADYFAIKAVNRPLAEDRDEM